ncbi:SMP-30/gluconolactonase/LRE family protein [Cryobacterium sp. TMT1-62]|uniref:SMP-30/gluconolactonase/LRE family protein n=1 Tax=Cryobacterium sp. TMT1-62 TaxID=1259240 RepID=UPI001F547EA4|nr:SMP-30/gluconolactonase/LRE family protein [Cryobacterium sp. TMT1-62]
MPADPRVAAGDERYFSLDTKIHDFTVRRALNNFLFLDIAAQQCCGIQVCNAVGDPEVFRSTGAILGESLIWDARGDHPAMLWCDITAGLIHRSPLCMPADGSADDTIALPPPVASFSVAEIGGRPGFIVSLEDRIVVTDSSGHLIRTVAEIHHSRLGLRLNEGKVDPAGRWITGSMNLFNDDPVGAFYSVSGDGDVRLLRGGIGVANGLEWSLDGRRIFFTDTSVGTIYTGAYSANGDITDVNVFTRGAPHDGLTIDTDGNFWGALYGGGKVVHYNSNGAEVFAIDIPALNLTSVAFGGADLSMLYVASARENLTQAQLEAYPLSGSVFAIQTDTQGRQPTPFFSRG